MIRYGGSWVLRWFARSCLFVCTAALGLLPYDYDIGGHCRIVANREVALRAQLDDEIEAIHVTDGQIVETNALIASLVAREERALLDEAEAEVEVAAANLKLEEKGPREEDIAKAVEQVAVWNSQLTYWEAELLRQKDLLREKATAVNSVEKALSSRDSAASMLSLSKEEEKKLKAGTREETLAAAAARLAKAKANLRLQQQRVPLCEIRSPIRGQVSTPGVHLRGGQTVAPGDLIAVVRDVWPVKVEVLADESAAPNVAPGMPVKIRLWGLYGALRTGTVERIESVARSRDELNVELFRSDKEGQLSQAHSPRMEDRFVKVLVVMDQEDPKLLPGMTGEARIVIAKDCFWNALTRQVVRFVLVEVWNWLP